MPDKVKMFTFKPAQTCQRRTPNDRFRTLCTVHRWLTMPDHHESGPISYRPVNHTDRLRHLIRLYVEATTGKGTIDESHRTMLHDVVLRRSDIDIDMCRG